MNRGLICEWPSLQTGVEAQPTRADHLPADSDMDPAAASPAGEKGGPTSPASPASSASRPVSREVSPQTETSLTSYDAGVAQEQPVQGQEANGQVVKDSPQGYIDPSGNYKRISPSQDVNLNQFYPSVDSTSLEQMENLASDSWDAPPHQIQVTNSQLVRVLVTPEQPARDGVLGPSMSTMFDDGRQTTMTSASGSISLPGSPTPSQSRENVNVFSTEVDENTLDAAKQRNKSDSLFPIEDWEMDKPAPLTLTQLVDTRAREHYDRGMMHMADLYYERAIICFNKAINLCHREAVYYEQRAECYLQMCDFQSAILNYKKTCVLSPDDFKYFSRLAFIYYFQGQCLFDQRLFTEALESFLRATEMRPEMVGCQTRTIACLAALQRHGECLALVNKRLDMEEVNADLYILRARLHEVFKNITLCYYDTKDALMLDPSHREAVSMMRRLILKAEEMKQQAMHFNLLGQHRDALHKITEAIETNPLIAEYHVLRGALNRNLRDFNGAIDDYLLAMDKTDHDEECEVYQESQRQLLLTYNDFAVECFTKGFYEEAIILLNKAIKGEKRERGLYINRGDCFFRQRHFEFALADYHQALEMSIADPVILSRIAIVHNEHGIVEYATRNLKEAEEHFSLAIQHSPRTGQYYISRARTRQLMENMLAASQDILIALHLDPGNDEISNLLSIFFPGKSVSDVMTSSEAKTAQSTLHNLISQARPIRLKPIDSSDTISVGGDCDVDKSSVFGYPPTLKKTGNLTECMKERDFNIRIVAEKAMDNQRVKEVLQSRDPLRYKSGRVGELPSPTDVKLQSRPLLERRKLAVPPNRGWKKFSLGIMPNDA